METVKGVSSGGEIILPKHGQDNPLAAVVPLPAKPDDSEYLATLTG